MLLHLKAGASGKGYRSPVANKRPIVRVSRCLKDLQVAVPVPITAPPHRISLHIHEFCAQMYSWLKRPIIFASGLWKWVYYITSFAAITCEFSGSKGLPFALGFKSYNALHLKNRVKY